MDRVNRRFFVASKFIAVPMVLLMASLTTGTSPSPDLGAVQHAVPQLSADEAGSQEPTKASPIQQVAAKQTQSSNTRPGLLEVITGVKPAGNQNHQHKNMSSNKSRGLLDGIFGSGSGSRNTHANHNHKPSVRTPSKQSPSQNKQQSQSPRPQSDVNWDGIPYHAPSGSNTKTAAAPVQDPASRSSAKGQSQTQTQTAQTNTPSQQPATRIIRGGSSVVTKAQTASVRRSSKPSPVDQDPTPADLPKPPAEIAPLPSNSEAFSANSSSRRSARRNLSTLEASVARRSTGSTNPANDSSSEQDVALVPRVSRTPTNSTEPISAKSKAEPTQVAAKISDQDDQASNANKSAQTESPEANTAIAAIGSPMVTAEPNSATDIAPSIESETAESVEAYSVPVDTTNAPIPTAGIPSHPYAASTPDEPILKGATPANTISHRSGPPVSAFEDATASQFAPYADGPIGSGVARHDNSASDLQPTEPVYQTARLPGSSSDPYGSHTHSPSNRLTTNGQPFDANGPSGVTESASDHAEHDNLARRSGNAAGVPMHSIPGYQQPNDFGATGLGETTGDRVTDSSDDFDRSTYATRNQMRGAASGSITGGMVAASELPGIRVVTQGPDSIMIRQTSQFEVRVENRGSIDAEGVLVRALVPDWADLGGQNASIGNVEVRQQGSAQQLVWTIDQLPAGTSERMFVRLTAARSGSYDIDVDWTLLPKKSITKVTVREPRLDLSIEGPDEVVYGQSQTYKVHVLNPGDGTAPNVVFTLSPNSATPQTQKIGDIPPGKEAQFDVELTAQDLGDLQIHGLAMGDYELRAEAAKTIRVAAANLEAMLNGPELKYQNSDATYNLQVQNTGSVASEKIIATLQIPSGVNYVGGIENGSLQGKMLRWEITSLPPGATRNYQFTCKMASTGKHLFAFDCKGTAAGSTGVSIATQVESIADLVLTVNDPPAPAPIGSEVTYEIVIRNRGSKEATDVRAVAQFSHGIEPKRIEGQSGEVVTGQVLFDPIERIGAGQEVRLRVIATADRGGHHRFRSEVRSGDTVLVAEEATHYMSPTSERVSRHSSDSSKR